MEALLIQLRCHILTPHRGFCLYLYCKCKTNFDIHNKKHNKVINNIIVNKIVVCFVVYFIIFAEL